MQSLLRKMYILIEVSNDLNSLKECRTGGEYGGKAASGKNMDFSQI